MLEPLLERLWTADQARAADAYTIDVGVPGLVLMEHAGRAVADIVARGQPRSALVIAGPGNTGGDGWVAARHLWGRGIPCPVVTLVAPDALGGDAHTSARLFLAAARAQGFNSAVLGAPYRVLEVADDIDWLLGALRPDVVIDALFGTGLRRALEGTPRAVVERLANFAGPIVSIDVPSGLPTDGAAPSGPCVRATTTVTFQRRKIAHACEPGRGTCGEVHVIDIGLLTPPTGNHPPVHRLQDARGLLPRVDVDAHKGRFGHVAVLAGVSTGAARLAGRAALRAGVGLVTILADAVPIGIEAELMVRGLDDSALTGVFAASGALVIGPGLGMARVDAARRLLEGAARARVPCVVDAEAIDALAPLRIAGLVAVITPHPGEAGRGLGVTSAQVQQDRIAAARALKQRFGPGIIIVLKGSTPVVIGDDDVVILVEGGAPALAVAGSGDVLAGVIGGLLARGMTPMHAALAGVQAHQRAGQALGAVSLRGHLASDIADAIVGALQIHAPL